VIDVLVGDDRLGVGVLAALSIEGMAARLEEFRCRVSPRSQEVLVQEAS